MIIHDCGKRWHLCDACQESEIQCDSDIPPDWVVQPDGRVFCPHCVAYDVARTTFEAAEAVWEAVQDEAFNFSDRAVVGK